MSWLRFIEKPRVLLAATTKWSKQSFCEPGRHSAFFREISVLIKETNNFCIISVSWVCSLSTCQQKYFGISVLLPHPNPPWRSQRWETETKERGGKKKKKSAWKSKEEGVRGEKSRDLERVQLSARDRSVSGSWQPRPDEETGWRHSKPGRESSTDGKERGTHLIKQWHLGNALACSLSFWRLGIGAPPGSRNIVQEIH